MKTPLKCFLIIAAGIGCSLGGYWYGRAGGRGGADAPGAAALQPAEGGEPAVTVAVETIPIRRAAVRQMLTAYGTIMAQPGDVTVISVPFESRMGPLRAIAGQEVAAGAVLGEIAPSPDTQLQIRHAKAALASAKLDLEQTQQRFSAQLATNSDLLQSRQNLAVAQLNVESFEASGATASQLLTAQSGGIVSKIDVQEGQIVPAGGPLVEIAAGSRIVARLGVEPEFAAMIHKGDAVTLRQVGAASAASSEGVVDLLAKRVNTDTRLVDVFVALPQNAGLILDGYVQGALAVASAEGLVVPRQAVLPGDDGYALFTVEQSRAVRHQVNVILQNDQETLVSGEGLRAGDLAVVVGNYELEDGTNVTAESATTQPASSGPADSGGGGR